MKLLACNQEFFLHQARRMRLVVVHVVLTVACSYTVAAPSFEGLWFTCSPNSAAGFSYSLVAIKREAGRYQVLQEWGANYTASGVGMLSGNKLVARGCTSFRGEVVSTCDVSNPPVFFTLTHKQKNARRDSLAIALRKSEPIRTTEQSWQPLVQQCERLVNS